MSKKKRRRLPVPPMARVDRFVTIASTAILIPFHLPASCSGIMPCMRKSDANVLHIPKTFPANHVARKLP